MNISFWAQQLFYYTLLLNYLQIWIKNFKMQKKTIDFKKRDPVKSETVINNNMMGQINTLSYAG
jgi:hypothetical protein